MVKLFCSNYWQNPQITAAVHYFQRKPPEVFYKKSCALKVRKYQTKIKRACNFITNKLQRRCFLVKFAKFLRIPILKNIGKQLLLYFHYNSHHHFHYHHFHYHQKQSFTDVLQNRCFTNVSEKEETIDQETKDPGNHRPKYFMAR